MAFLLKKCHLYLNVNFNYKKGFMVHLLFSPVDN